MFMLPSSRGVLSTIELEHFDPWPRLHADIRSNALAGE